MKQKPSLHGPVLKCIPFHLFLYQCILMEIILCRQKKLPCYLSVSCHNILPLEKLLCYMSHVYRCVFGNAWVELYIRFFKSFWSTALTYLTERTTNSTLHCLKFLHVELHKCNKRSITNHNLCGHLCFLQRPSGKNLQCSGWQKWIGSRSFNRSGQTGEVEIFL